MAFDVTQLKPGDMCFAMHNNNVISKVLAWFMSPTWFSSARWSHSFILVGTTDTGYIVTCETSDYEVTFGYLQLYLSDPEVDLEIWQADLDLPTRTKIIAECASNWEDIYGYLQFISLGIRGLLAKCGIHISNFIRISWTCNENVQKGYFYSGIPGLAGVDPKSMQTNEYYAAMLATGKFNLVLAKPVGNTIDVAT
jgi:hypothetical protein